MSETAEYDIANTAKYAIVNGIDEHGSAVAVSGTPAYGGTSAGEDFIAESNSGNEPFNVYAFQGDDEVNSFSAPLMPCIVVIIEGHPPSETVFNNEVKAVTITWWIQIGMFCGWVTSGGTLFKDAKAMSIWRNRLTKVLDKISFSGISIISENVVEPIGIAKSDGEEGDNTVWTSGASKYIEYVEEI